MFKFEFEEQQKNIKIKDLKLGDVFIGYDGKYMKTIHPSFAMSLHHFSVIEFRPDDTCNVLFNVIDFDEKKDIRTPIFKDVETAQYFISNNGSIWLKTNYDSATKICDGNGCPCAFGMEWNENESIQRALPIVKSIKWED